MKSSFELKQTVVTAMVSGHTREVRLKFGIVKAGTPYIRRAEDMQPFKIEFLSVYLKNHTILSLRSHPAIDIKPIVKIIDTGPYQRHCSTTFYQ